MSEIMRRSMYVNDWDDIFKDETKLKQLGYFCDLLKIIELHFYDIRHILPEDESKFSNAIQYLKNNHNIKYFNAVYDSLEVLDDIKEYQDKYGNLTGVMLVYEWWNNNPSDFSTALALMEKATTLGLERHTYLGWFVDSEIDGILENTDILHIYAYLDTPDIAYVYMQRRLRDLRHKVIKFAPIYSAQSHYMGSWFNEFSIYEAENIFDKDMSESSTDYSNLTRTGFTYFTYEHMLANINLSDPNILRRSMYVDNWVNIYTDGIELENLGNYCDNFGINELHLYDLHQILPEDPTNLNTAIEYLKNNHNILHFNAAYSSLNQLKDIKVFQDVYKQFTGVILEYEWWNNDPRDFSYALILIKGPKEIGLKLETQVYTGWYDEMEVDGLVNNVDILYLHAYRVNPYDTYVYTRSRLQLIKNYKMKFGVIFSAEPNFMGPWFKNNSIIEAEKVYNDDYNAATTDYSNLTKVGFNYFDYSFMKYYLPKP